MTLRESTALSRVPGPIGSPASLVNALAILAKQRIQERNLEVAIELLP
jgi:hypothetical protein